MHKLKQKLKLLQKMLSQIHNINKEMVFEQKGTAGFRNIIENELLS
ncbi:MAG: hypothetical protein AB3N34_01085 [Lettuce witches'-broom phytoplasma]